MLHVLHASLFGATVFTATTMLPRHAMVNGPRSCISLNTFPGLTVCKGSEVHREIAYPDEEVRKNLWPLLHVNHVIIV